MKKLIAVAIFVSAVGPRWAFADDSFCTDWSKFNLCIPVASGVDGAFGYDFKGHQSRGLAETKVGSMKINSYSRAIFKFGGVTSDDGKGSPFLGADYELNGIKNPIPILADIRPGFFGGKNFSNGEYFYGIKASIEVMK